MNELTTKLMCVQMRTGVEIWVDGEKSQRLQQVLQGITQSKFIHHDGQTINTADIVGVFTAGTMEEHTRRRKGEWKCAQNNWHERKTECRCLSASQKELLEQAYGQYTQPQISDEEMEVNRKALEKLRKTLPVG